MTRKFLTTTATIAALIAVPALAQDNTTNPDLKTNSPAVTDGGKMNEAASNQFKYDIESPRISNGYAEYDANQIAMSQSAFRALSNARGENMETTDGTVVGMIENVNVSGQGNPELVVQLTDEQAAKFNTDVLVITVTPGNVAMEGDKLALTTTLDDLVLAAEQGDKGSYADRKSVTLP
tara:strand:- start:1427 stop:1963 length:537 start_codon:yes stop_codon:yes gene_type:complete